MFQYISVVGINKRKQFRTTEAIISWINNTITHSVKQVSPISSNFRQSALYKLYLYRINFNKKYFSVLFG